MRSLVPYACPRCSAEIPSNPAPPTCVCGFTLGTESSMPDFVGPLDSPADERGSGVRANMERGHAWTLARAGLVRALIAESDGPDPLVLDAGCGTGAFATSLAAEGLRVSAIDRRKPEVACDVQFARADITALPFADSTFDIVLLLDVLEHIEDEPAALKQTRRVLRPGGALILTVPALKRLWSRRDELAGHMRRYELDELRTALGSAGFSVERIGFWAATTLPLLTVSRSLSRRGPGLLHAEENPPALVDAVLRPLLRYDARRALARGWKTGSSLFAVARRPI